MLQCEPSTRRPLLQRPLHFAAARLTALAILASLGMQALHAFTNLSQRAYIKASNPGIGDSFGIGLAISGDTVVSGAYLEDSDATTINGGNNNLRNNAGAAYVLVRDGTNWLQEAYLKASNSGTNDFFGRSAAISGDTIVVGANNESSAATGVNGNGADNSAPGAGAAYVFVRSGAGWSQQAYLKASNAGAFDSFGNAVGISGDTIVVGAPYEQSNATGVNGDQANNSAGFAGAAYVFVRSGSTWIQQAYLKASNTGANDEFGTVVAIDGDTIVVGAPGEGSIDGVQTNNLAAKAGAVYVFTRSGTTWTQQAYLKASNIGIDDRFGSAVALSGDTLVVGASDEDSNATGVDGNQANNAAGNAGAAYVFKRSGVAWTQQAYLKASNAEAGDRFGISVAVAADTIVVGASGEDSNANRIDGSQANQAGATDHGAAYVFARTNETHWIQRHYVKASNAEAADQFGSSVAASTNLIAIAALGEASDATGVNGNQFNNSAAGSGAVYLFGDPVAQTGGVTARIVSLTYDPLQVILECLGEPDAIYEIERSDDHPDNSWNGIDAQVAMANGSFTATDLSPPTGSAFYRLRKRAF